MKKILNKYKTFYNYVIIGIVGTIINISVYMFLVHFFQEGYLICNVIAYLISLICIYIMNKIIVFKDNITGYKNIMKQFGFFGLSRLVSLGIDTSVLFICFEMLSFSNLISKIIANMTTTLLNYFVGKKLIFK